MTNRLAETLRELATDRGTTQPDTAVLWRHGRQRRARTTVAATLAGASVLLLMLGVVLPLARSQSLQPATPLEERLTTFPARIGKPLVMADSREVLGVRAALVVTRDDVYPVSPDGTVTAVRGIDGLPSSASLSLSGRWLSVGLTLVDLLTGAVIDRTDMVLSGSYLPFEEAGWWSPDSTQVLAPSLSQGAVTSLGVVLSTDPKVSALLRVPALPGDGPQPVLAGWIDNTRVLGLVPRPASSAEGDMGTRLTSMTWEVGTAAWVPGDPSLVLGQEAVDLSAQLSPAGSTVVLRWRGSEGPGQYASAFDIASGRGRGMPFNGDYPSDWAPGSFSPAPAGRCRAVWRDNLPTYFDGTGISDPTGEADNLPQSGWEPATLVDVDESFGASCLAVAGDTLRGEPTWSLSARLETWAGDWGLILGPLLLLVLLIAILRRRFA